MRHVVFLHGFTGSPASFNATRKLSQHSYEALCPSLAGHGQPYAIISNQPPEGTFVSEVDRIAELCRQDKQLARSESRVLCGYSLGARVALAMLIRHPHLFTQGILIGVHPGLASASQRRMRRQADDALVTMLTRHGLAQFVDHWQRLPLFATQTRVSPAAVYEQQQIRLTHTALGLAHSLETCGLSHMPDYQPRLSNISVPVTLVVGSEDTKFVALARQICPALPRGRLDIVPNCGHNVPLEMPATVAAILDRSLQ